MTRKGQAASNDARCSIGIAARRLGVSIHAMRTYEREGLVLPARTAMNARVYSEIEISKIDAITRMISELRLNFATLRRVVALVPCHRIRDDCTRATRAKCEFFKHKDRPCWTYDTPCRAANGCDACHRCPVYTETLEYADIQRMITT